MLKAWRTLRQQLGRWQGVLIVGTGTTCLAIAGSLMGLFQLPEWMALDLLFRLRPAASQETRIVLVTIDEADLKQVGQWPIPDRTLAQALKTIKAQQPRLIGLDLYRDLPVEPGYQELVKVLQSTPNLIAVEKAVGERVAPPEVLGPEQIASSDILFDADGKVRRSLLSAELDGQVKLGLAAKLALKYLEDQDITLQEKSTRFWQRQQLTLGQATIVPFLSHDGGYVRADDGGYQILLNYRGPIETFPTVSLSDVLANRIPPELMSDRIVLIGSTAPSLNDFFYTPYSSSLNGSPRRVSGVVVHANAIAQLLGAALEGRPLLRVWSAPIEWLWIGSWSFAGATLSWSLAGIALKQKVELFIKWLLLSIGLPGGALLGMSYGSFLLGWWVPTATPGLVLLVSALASAGHKNYQLGKLASLDGLTGIANRRYFDQNLHREWYQHQHPYLSLILCDVDFFKRYNDTYGHQAGDECLQQVAKAIRQATRSSDLVARYGGEEFVVILPNTKAEVAVGIARRICAEVKARQMPHQSSEAGQYVSLSCGVASTTDYKEAPSHLIAAADRALYQAKEQGRDRALLSS
ncbi:MAG: CHASE2 domain-containing protein [Cyanophyceae cyanobacterium]